MAGLRNNGEALPRNMYQTVSANRGFAFKIKDLTIDQDGGPTPYGTGAYGRPPKMKAIKKEQGTESNA